MKLLLTVVLLVVSGTTLFASSGSLSQQMTSAMLQFAIIIFAGWLGGRLAKAVKLPAVVGQILLGVIISPFALGGLALPGFPDGFIPHSGSPVAVNEIIYAFSTLATIILLFMSGLETDLKLFRRYAAKGGVVGTGGVIASYFAGAGITAALHSVSLFSAEAMFMGALCVATSVGITASLLSNARKMDSPEGTVIMAAAVIDDILGILILAVVLGVSSGGGSASVESIAWTLGRALLVVAVVGILGLSFAKGIGRGLKAMATDTAGIAVLAFGLTLFISGLVESAGLSMIIGAYICGLSLSNTELAFMLQERLKILMDVFVPVLFVVSGMMVDISAILQPEVFGIGLLFTLLAILAKILGSGGPALLLNFNFTGAMRIGWGMVPRGEVALIIAGIGVGAGILDSTLFGIGMLMTIGTTVIAPPILNKFLSLKRSGQRVETPNSDREESLVELGSPLFAELILNRFIAIMEAEGFYSNRLEHGSVIYQLRKDSIFFSLEVLGEGRLSFLSDKDSTGYIHTVLYESLVQVGDSASQINEGLHAKRIAQRTQLAIGRSKDDFDCRPFLSSSRISLTLAAKTKRDALIELIALYGDELANPDAVLQEILKRESSMSTALDNGIAFPHVKTAQVKKISIAVGLVPEGLDFGNPNTSGTHIIVMILSPKAANGPHLQVLSSLASRLHEEEAQKQLLAAKTPEKVIELLTPGKKSQASRG